MNKKEELLKNFHEETRRKEHKFYLALFLSFLLNLIITLITIFTPRAPHHITFHAKPIPTVFLDEPIPQSRSSNHMPTLPQPVTQQQSALQQQAAQLPPQPQPLSKEEQKKFEYLVKQLISCGNANNGQVALAAGPDPDGDTAPPPAEEKKDEEQIASSPSAEPISEKIAQKDTLKEEKDSAINGETLKQAEPVTETEPLEKPMVIDGATAKVIVPTPRQPKPVTPLKEKKTHDTRPIAQSQQRPAPTRSATPAAQKKQLSLADLANSFMKQVHKERSLSYNYDPSKKNGGGAPGVHSPTNAAANSQELALQMYASKVFTLMQQAAHSLTSLIYAQDDFEANTMLEITIDYKGRLLASRLNPSITEKDIEAAVQTIIQRVGLFPQIPKHFDTDTITLTFPLNIRGSKGFGKYSLFYGSRA